MRCYTTKCPVLLMDGPTQTAATVLAAIHSGLSSNDPATAEARSILGRYHATGTLTFDPDAKLRFLRALGLLPTPSDRTQMDFSNRDTNPLSLAQLVEHRAVQAGMRRVTISHVLSK